MWITKYAPVNWSHFIGNSATIAKAKQWIENFPGPETATSDRVLLIAGPEGSGKTCAAIMLLAGYKIFRFTLQDIKSHKKDTELLNNFCELYKSNRQAFDGKHAIIIDDFESVTKADKPFHAVLVDLVTNFKGTPPPLILTVTTLPFVSTKKRTKSYQGIAKLATEIVLTPLKVSDIIGLLQRIANTERITMEDKVAMLIADNAQGDARKAVQTLEIISQGAKNNARKITNDVALDWIDQNSNDNDEKLAYDVKGSEGTSTKQGLASDEDRIIHVAFISQDQKASEAATRILYDNSKTFTPLLFQFYLNVATMDKVAEIANDFSEADVVQENCWVGGCAGFSDESEESDFTTSYIVELPIRRIQNLKGLRGSNRTVRTTGYQSYYGFENTAKSQANAALAVRSCDPRLYRTSPEGLVAFQAKVALALDNDTDEEVLEFLKEYNFHPDSLDNLAKLKSDTDFSITKRRKTQLVKLWNAHLEELSNKPTVKFTTVPTVPTVPTVVDANDPFALQWD